MRRTQGWVNDHYVYFAARFSEPVRKAELFGDFAVLTFAPEVEKLTAGGRPVVGERRQCA